jgi:type II secretory pathway component PulM
MMKLNLSARDRRALALGALGAVVMLVWSLGVAPWLEAVAHTRERLESARDLLAREQQLLAEARGYPALWELGAARLLEVAPTLFAAGNDGAAGAALAGYLQTLAKQERVFVLQVEPLPTEDAGGGLTALTVRLRAESDLEGVLRFLDVVEAGPRLVRVRQLQIERPTSRSGRSQPGALTVLLTATGYTLSELPPPEAGMQPRREEVSS